MALGVVVLALDGIPPVMRHLEEPSFQRRVATLDLCDPMLCLETRIECVRLIEIGEHVAVPFLGPVELRQLLRHVGFQQKIFCFLGALTRPSQVLSGSHVVASFPGNNTYMSEYLPPPRG